MCRPRRLLRAPVLKGLLAAVAVASALVATPALAIDNGGLGTAEPQSEAPAPDSPSTDDEAGARNGETDSATLRTVTATWYGPGLYGNRTACGRKLTPRTRGIAHLRLPCFSRVRIAYRGRSVTTRVIDRGPYGGAATIDIAAGTAKQLGFNSTDRVRFAPL